MHPPLDSCLCSAFPPRPLSSRWAHLSTPHPARRAASAAAAEQAPPGTCAVATPGRRLQSPPPPPPGSAVTSCSCFPVGPVGLTFESAFSCGEGSAGPAEKVARREAGLSRAEPGARGRRRRASGAGASPRLPARPGGSGKCGRSGASGRSGRTREPRAPAVLSAAVFPPAFHVTGLRCFYLSVCF